MSLFLNKYRNESIRLPNYDYTSSGYYFVTICTDDRNYYFGSIENGDMQLSDYGKIAQFCWVEIPNHFKHALLDEYIIMPNHIHGILILTDRKETNSNQVQEAFGKPVVGSLGTILRSYKSAVTKMIHEKDINSPKKIWQKGYYEKILRSEKGLFNVQRYINQNPKNWIKDRLFIK